MNNSTPSDGGLNTPAASLATTARQAKERFASCSAYVRDNPWIGAAGAALLGAVIVSLVRPSRPKPTTLESVRHWIDGALEKMPTQKETGTALCKVLKKLHVPV